MKETMKFSAITGAIREQARLSLKGHKETIPINTAYAVFFLHLVLYAARFLYAIVSVDYSILTPNILYYTAFDFQPGASRRQRSWRYTTTTLFLPLFLALYSAISTRVHSVSSVSSSLAWVTPRLTVCGLTAGKSVLAKHCRMRSAI